jgi:hypothetical protein
LFLKAGKEHHAANISAVYCGFAHEWNMDRFERKLYGAQLSFEWHMSEYEVLVAWTNLHAAAWSRTEVILQIISLGRESDADGRE